MERHRRPFGADLRPSRITKSRRHGSVRRKRNRPVPVRHQPICRGTIPENPFRVACIGRIRRLPSGAHGCAAAGKGRTTGRLEPFRRSIRRSRCRSAWRVSRKAVNQAVAFVINSTERSVMREGRGREPIVSDPLILFPPALDRRGNSDEPARPTALTRIDCFYRCQCGTSEHRSPPFRRDRRLPRQRLSRRAPSVDFDHSHHLILG